jgi:hypothetical protein
MFNNTIVESLVSLRALLRFWRKNVQTLECGSINLLEFGPSNELIRNKTLEEFPLQIHVSFASLISAYKSPT